ncbi:pantoate--beta-alanine ligase [Isoalcanivorax beigongshangi]|uniref:Pantothenate synthetase n=1 Tax=Isoalcanivorax beigongshangi TaxID=3238810 RepID=A0ABV4AJN3_9GAMM
MQTLHRIAEVRARVAAWKAAGERVALVPTMGNLHSGHIRLVTTAREHADRVVASVFVNPTQFGPTEDFDSYPRTLEADQEKLAAAGCDLLFAPSADEMYPEPNLTWVEVDQLGDHLCGAARPGHFRGVTTVVSKLFNIVTPDVACFGEKDYQQLAVIRRMVQDLCYGIEIIGVTTEREDDGLALSSRNGYLSAEQRQQAPALYATLRAAQAALERGDRDYPALIERARAQLEAAGFVVDYFQIVDAEKLYPVTPDTLRLHLAAAARLGETRLIDNLPVAIVRD